MLYFQQSSKKPKDKAHEVHTLFEQAARGSSDDPFILDQLSRLICNGLRQHNSILACATEAHLALQEQLNKADPLSPAVAINRTALSF